MLALYQANVQDQFQLWLMVDLKGMTVVHYEKVWQTDACWSTIELILSSYITFNRLILGLYVSSPRG